MHPGQPAGVMSFEAALRFVGDVGVVLVSARGPVPRLVEVIAGEAIRGSWWGHPRGREIYATLQQLAESDEILVCRLVEGKVTFVHRRLWPALVCLREGFSDERLARVHEVHTALGRHENRTIPFPDWVPADVFEAAALLSEREAALALGTWVTSVPKARSSAGPKRVGKGDRE